MSFADRVFVVGEPMNFYRCYFLSASNAIKDVAEFCSHRSLVGSSFGM